MENNIYYKGKKITNKELVKIIEENEFYNVKSFQQFGTDIKSLREDTIKRFCKPRQAISLRDENNKQHSNKLL